VTILLFFTFIVLVAVRIFTSGYVLSSLEKRTVNRRCRVPHETTVGGRSVGSGCDAGTKTSRVPAYPGQLVLCVVTEPVHPRIVAVCCHRPDGESDARMEGLAYGFLRPDRARDRRL
jgi:hypothetical protein